MPGWRSNRAASPAAEHGRPRPASHFCPNPQARQAGARCAGYGDPMAMRSLPPRSAGFTVAELLIVITIAAILAAIGIPSFRAITNSSRISGEVNGLLG